MSVSCMNSRCMQSGVRNGDGGCVSVPASWREQRTAPSPSQRASRTRLVPHRDSLSHSSTVTDYYGMFTRLADSSSLYSCNVCGKTVSNRWHHSVIHRPQVNCCPMCHQTFTRKDNMKVHMKIKHGGVGELKDPTVICHQ